MINLNISKDGKTLYFSDDEIKNSTNGEKKVYVTKRINGKESHSKVEKLDNKTFDFNNEIVIGVTPKKTINEQEIRKKNISKKKNQKNNNHTKSKINKSNDMEKAERKYKNNKKYKKQKLSKKVIGFFSSLLLIGAIIIIALTAPIFNIIKIEVNGNNKVPTETIISISGLKKGENIFRFNKSIIQNIKENQYIEEAKIKRKLPGTIQIFVTEREVKYQIKLVNSYAYINKNGYILEVSSIKSEVPIIVGFNISENELINKKRLETKDL